MPFVSCWKLAKRQGHLSVLESVNLTVFYNVGEVLNGAVAGTGSIARELNSGEGDQMVNR